MPSTSDLGTDEVLGLALAWLAEGRKVALATVIETWGSAPRRPGSRLLVDSDGDFAGSVSGGCIEGAVIQEAREAIGDGKLRSLNYGVSDEEAWEVGLSCGGQIKIMIEPVTGKMPETITEIRKLQQERKGCVLVTDLDNEVYLLITDIKQANDKLLENEVKEALRLDQGRLVAILSRRLFIEPFLPRPRLVVVGAVHIAQALVGLARQLEYDTIVVDPRDAWIKEERFPGVKIMNSWPDVALEEIGVDGRTAVATLTHDPKIDDPALKAALERQAPYVGALGSKRTHAKRLQRLKEEGMDDEQLARIDAPIGLDIGAATAAEIALAIMAQIVQRFRGA